MAFLVVGCLISFGRMLWKGVCASLPKVSAHTRADAVSLFYINMQNYACHFFISLCIALSR